MGGGVKYAASVWSEHDKFVESGRQVSVLPRKLIHLSCVSAL